MNRQENGVNTGTGGISILAVFVVLCLTTLATLSFVSARADHSLAEKTSLSSQQYYAADAQAEEKLMQVVRLLKTEDWQGGIQGLGCTLEREDGVALVGYDIEVNEIKTLHVEIELPLGAGDVPTGEWARRTWRVSVAESDEPVQGMNVYV